MRYRFNLVEILGEGYGFVWEHRMRGSVNGATCECGCGSTRARVVPRLRGLGQSLQAKKAAA